MVNLRYLKTKAFYLFSLRIPFYQYFENNFPQKSPFFLQNYWHINYQTLCIFYLKLH